MISYREAKSPISNDLAERREDFTTYGNIKSFEYATPRGFQRRFHIHIQMISQVAWRFHHLLMIFDSEIEDFNNPKGLHRRFIIFDERNSLEFIIKDERNLL